MDFVKKNLVSVICGLVALVALVVVFYPISGLYTALREKVATRAAAGPAIDKLLKERRTLPTLSPNAEDAKPLTVYPTKAIITYGKSITAGWTTASQNFFARASSLNALTPLVPDVLPKYGDDKTKAVRFRQAYRAKFGMDLKPEDGRDKDKTSIAVTVLNGGLPPNAGEILRRQISERTSIESHNLKFQNGKKTNAEEVEKLVNAKLVEIPKTMREDAAKTFKIYVGRDAFEPSAAIGIDTLPSAATIFDAQVRLWVQEEFSKAITETNTKAGATNVLDAPIKRLVKISSIYHPYGGASAPSNPALPGGGFGSVAGAAADSNAAPATLALDETGTMPTAYTVTPTGHTSNPLYDVVAFDATLVVDVARLPKVLNDLAAGRFITIRNVEILTLNSAVERAAGFIYGPVPVVQIRIECEYLFLRKWLAPLMPPEVIAHLSAPAAASGM